MNRLKSIIVEDKELLLKYLMKYNNYLCEFNFLNLNTWTKEYGFKWMIYNDRLVIYSSKEDIIYMPLGEKLSPEDLLEISDIFLDDGKSGNMMFIFEKFVHENLSFLEKHFSIFPDRANFDYIYETKSLAELKGKKLHKKRNLISQFERRNPEYTVAKLDKEHQEGCLSLCQKWCDLKSCDREDFIIEMKAIKALFERFEKLNGEGLCLIVEDKIVAFSIFSRLSKDTFDVHFEKFDINYKGAAQIINRETARYLQERCNYINREQDMGIPGLRKNKRSYKPVFLAKSYKLIRRKKDKICRK
ncbi:MAG: hypothetical protein C0601_01255 [Candidatus Muiribacterium halophilum]|uniref:Phosphatidylglycerol lysyltransferase C-terminal domain-containing protein n=1 Tax=Muiribacterium halophilum TaxID=2053465 RepID=A0A2N5ZLT1_MUIH1|nr:MAG: hypothetical protein C0601_01255 [Candidatus Muirbacterium halophilum]